MERNTFLAILLSVVVLFTYQAVFVGPKQKQLKESQVISNQELALKESSNATIQSNDNTITTNTSQEDKIYDISTTDGKFSFNSVGGSLHKVEFSPDASFPIKDILKIESLANVPYEGQKIDDQKISLSYKDRNLQVTKSYDLDHKELIKVRMEIKNLSEISILNNAQFKAFEIDTSRLEINSNRNYALFEYSLSDQHKILRKGSATKFSDKNNLMGTSPLNWVGFRDHYNAFVIKPEFETKSYEIKSDSEKTLSISFEPVEKTLAPGESVVYEFSIYAGPQNPWIMKSYHKGFEKIFAFSNFFIIEWIGKAIYYTIPVFHGIFKSWGVAIILISLLIYGLTYPLTMKSMMSMRKMQEIQPKLNALKERHKNDPQKLNVEMIEIYRREKINPFGGCLPFLIQMPFFMALYQILWRAQYFQGQGFLWIKDLSQPDRLIIFPFYLPLIGNELNILPILTGGIMFLQQKISSKNMIATDEQQIMQQKMMMYILPVMMTFMFYKFASSWAIYFLVFYILSTAAQWRISKVASKK